MPLGDYQDFSERELKLGLWFTKHRLVIKAIFLSVGFFFFGILIFFNINSLVDYYTGNEIDKLQGEMLANTVWNTVARAKFQPKALRWQPVQVIKRSGNFDLVVKVLNPNKNWTLNNLVYHFESAGWKSDKMNTYILPGQERFLVLVNLNKKSLPINLSKDLSFRVVADNLNWKRIKPNDNLISSSGLEADNVSIRKLSGNITTLNFLINNKSDYNYKQIEITTLVFNGDKIAAVNFLEMDNILSGENYPVSLRWFGDLPPITSWQIDLSTNILDKNNLLRFTKNQFGNQ